MIKNLKFFLLLNIVFTIGIDGLKVPTNIFSLGSGKTNHLAVSNLSDLFNDNSFIEYSSISWIPGINGKSIQWKNGNGLLKHVSVSTIVDNDIYFFGETPNDDSDIKLPASLYSASFVFAGKYVGLNTAFEIKPFLSRLYYEKDYGLILNFYSEKKINTFNSLTFSVNNFGTILGENEELLLPDMFNFQYKLGFKNNPHKLGIGINLDKNQYSSFGYLSLEKSFLKSSFSIDYNNQIGFGYSWSMFIDYKNLTFGFSIGSPILESISNPQIISIKFNF